jgi:hypothetical protein
MPSVIQEWVSELGLRHQGVLMSCVRGCDSVSKEDPTKAVARSLRAMILVSFDPEPTSFIDYAPINVVYDRMNAVLKDHDHYPVHYIMHLMHGSEIIGYKHPDYVWRDCCWWFYWRLCKCFHVTPETEEQLDARLGACESKFKENSL